MWVCRNNNTLSRYFRSPPPPADVARSVTCFILRAAAASADTERRTAALLSFHLSKCRLTSARGRGLRGRKDHIDRSVVTVSCVSLQASTARLNRTCRGAWSTKTDQHCACVRPQTAEAAHDSSKTSVCLKDLRGFRRLLLQEKVCVHEMWSPDRPNPTDPCLPGLIITRLLALLFAWISNTRSCSCSRDDQAFIDPLVI